MWCHEATTAGLSVSTRREASEASFAHKYQGLTASELCQQLDDDLSFDFNVYMQGLPVGGSKRTPPPPESRLSCRP